MSNPSDPQPEPEILPPGQEHGYKESEVRRASGPGVDGSIEDLGRQVSGLMRHPLSMPRVTYALYAVSVVSGFPMLVGLIVAYVVRGEAPHWLQTHYTFLIRTFWYFIALVLIGVALAFLLVGFMLLWLLPLWLAIRVVRGWLLLENKKPIPNPESWLFG
ncbi:MAG: hypothetical protein NUV50_13365 [Rhodospirillales bacterium]|nr:hypothetical protein [Rhodospirillales bacterium]